MKLSQRRARPARTGFTLIELLVVIAIIAVLVGLTTAAVMRIFTVAPRTETLHEMTQMTSKLKAFMDASPGKPTFLPSKVVLFEDVAQYGPVISGSVSPPAGATQQDVKNSWDALSKLFGRRLGSQGQIDWNGNGTLGETHILEGQYALVFWLGGIPDQANVQCLGFSKNPANPAAATASAERYEPFPFKTARLVRGTGGFFTYNDPYGTPYAYFSNNGLSNGYGVNDCPTLGLTAYQSGGKFLNPDTFQIISAGPDKNFGAGGASTFNAATGSFDVPTRDNLTNFSRRQLEAAQG